MTDPDLRTCPGARGVTHTQSRTRHGWTCSCDAYARVETCKHVRILANEDGLVRTFEALGVV